MLVLPLGVTAAGLDAVWWILPPAFGLIWWFAPRDTGWEWLVALQSGLVGIEWGYAGACALGQFPQWFPELSIAWAGFPLALATAGLYLRHRERTS